MACPVCGNPSPCAHEQMDAAHAVGEREPRAVASRQHPSLPLAVTVSGGEILDHSDDRFWRQEVVSRVQQHRARRRRRCDPHASMEFDFQAGAQSSAEIPTPAKPEQPKIIEFPRPAVAPRTYRPQLQMPEPEELELAEPVIEAPRILDAPEPPPQQMELLPTFADIQLEAEESRRVDQVELPLQPAAIAHRLFAGLIDIIVVLMASVLFAFGFAMFAGGLPQLRQSMLYGLLVLGALWLIYEYLFLVHSSGTPGMQLAQLELCTFKGEPVSARLRRWRALASVLSGFALGLGFAWALVDEDTLGWHDRITQTHMRKSN